MIISTSGLAFAPDEIFELKVKNDMRGLYLYASEGNSRYKLSMESIYRICPTSNLATKYNAKKKLIDSINNRLIALEEFKNVEFNTIDDIEKNQKLKNSDKLIRLLFAFIPPKKNEIIDEITKHDILFDLKNKIQHVQNKETLIQISEQYCRELLKLEIINLQNIKPIYISTTKQTMDNLDIILNYQYNLDWMDKPQSIIQTPDLDIMAPFSIENTGGQMCYIISLFQCIAGNKKLLNEFNNAIKHNINYTGRETIFSFMRDPRKSLDYFCLETGPSDPLSVLNPYTKFFKTRPKFTCECELDDIIISKYIYLNTCGKNHQIKAGIDFIISGAHIEHQSYDWFAYIKLVNRHYIAYRKYKDIWYELNDANMTILTLSPTINDIAYEELFFYEKKI